MTFTEATATCHVRSAIYRTGDPGKKRHWKNTHNPFAKYLKQTNRKQTGRSTTPAMTMRGRCFRSMTKEKAMADDTTVSVEEVRAAVANYMRSEGCACCQNVAAHEKYTEVLAKLLDVEPYDDGSGYDFDKYATKP